MNHFGVSRWDVKLFSPILALKVSIRNAWENSLINLANNVAILLYEVSWHYRQSSHVLHVMVVTFRLRWTAYFVRSGSLKIQKQSICSGFKGEGRLKGQCVAPFKLRLKPSNCPPWFLPAICNNPLSLRNNRKRAFFVFNDEFCLLFVLALLFVMWRAPSYLHAYPDLESFCEVKHFCRNLALKPDSFILTSTIYNPRVDDTAHCICTITIVQLWWWKTCLSSQNSIWRSFSGPVQFNITGVLTPKIYDVEWQLLFLYERTTLKVWCSINIGTSLIIAIIQAYNLYLSRKKFLWREMGPFVARLNTPVATNEHQLVKMSIILRKFGEYYHSDAHLGPECTCHLRFCAKGFLPKHNRFFRERLWRSVS